MAPGTTMPEMILDDMNRPEEEVKLSAGSPGELQLGPEHGVSAPPDTAGSQRVS